MSDWWARVERSCRGADQCNGCGPRREKMQESRGGQVGPTGPQQVVLHPFKNLNGRDVESSICLFG